MREFLHACRDGDIIQVKNLISEKGPYNWNVGLAEACFGGHLHVAEFIMSKGASDYNYSLSQACYGGHLHMTKFMICKGASDYNLGLMQACYGGHMELVNLMIEKGADNWFFGLGSACYSGHLNIVKLMISKGANNVAYGLLQTCWGSGNLQIADLLISMMESQQVNDLSDAFRVACGRGHIEIIELLQCRNVYDWNLGLQNAWSHADNRGNAPSWCNQLCSASRI